jgi:hypothetical protein
MISPHCSVVDSLITVVSSQVLVAGGGGGGTKPGRSISPAGVLKAMADTSNAATRKFLTGFIDLLLKM